MTHPTRRHPLSHAFSHTFSHAFSHAVTAAAIAVAMLLLALGLMARPDGRAAAAPVSSHSPLEQGVAAPAPATAPISVISARTTTTTTTYLYLPTLIQGDPTSPVSDTLSPAQRMAAIESMDTILNDTIDLSIPFDQRNLVSELEQVAAKLTQAPNVLTVLVYTETLTIQAILDDGFSILVNNNRPPGGENQSGNRAENRAENRAGEWAQPFIPLAPDAVDDNVPGSGRAVVAAFDGGWDVANPVIDTLRERSYTIASTSASVAGMKNYRNLGAIYLDTHGTGWTEVLGVNVAANGTKTPRMGSPKYALQTSSSVALQSFETTYKDDLAQGRLTVQFTEVNGSMQAKLAITEKFISHYWKLDDAIVMIHSCFSGAGPFTSAGQCYGSCAEQKEFVFDPRPIRQAILAAGAHVVVGFDNYTNATMAKKNILFFFDRLTGANINEPTTPPTRPFPALDVWGQMARENRLTFNKPAWIGPFGITVGGNQVNFTFDATNTSTALAPSIRYVDVTDDAGVERGKLEIYGSFGATKGEVEVDGTNIPVTSWTKTKIEAEAPYSGLSSRGYLVVKSPDKVRSNFIPFTDWYGTITFSQKPNLGTLEAKATMNVHFRADLHSYRQTIDGTPVDRPPVDVYLNGASNGTVQASGTHTEDDATVTWSGGGTMDVYNKASMDTWAQTSRTPLAPQASNSNQNFGGIVTLDAKNRTARLCLILLGEYTQQVSSPDGSNSTASILFLGSSIGLEDNARGFLACYNLTMNADYSLAAGSRQVTVEGTTLQIEWTTFTPFAPPTDRTPS